MSHPLLDRRSLLIGMAGITSGFVPSLTSSSAAYAADDDKILFMKSVVAEQKARKKEDDNSISSDAIFTGRLPSILPFGDWDFYYINDVLSWMPASGQTFNTVEVPLGFATDLASIPRLLWSAFPRTGRYAYAAIVHDYLYWYQPMKREEADQIFALAMQDSKVPPATLATLFQAVNLGGQSAWDANKKARDKGEKRILKTLPSDPLISWGDWIKKPDVFLR